MGGLNPHVRGNASTNPALSANNSRQKPCRFAVIAQWCGTRAMINPSQLTTNATAAERRVIEALNSCDVDGVGYFRFSLPRMSGPPIQEPDIVLVLRGGKLAIIEVKGCKIEDVVAIDGDAWIMLPDWPGGTERPRTQARGYALVLKEVLASRGVAAWIDWRVALPFVSSADWRSRGFPDQGGAVLFGDEMTAEHLRRVLVPRAATPSALPAMAGALGDIFGSSAAAMAREAPLATTSPGAETPGCHPSIIRLTYSGRPPTDEELVGELDLGPPEGTLYLTATAALEQMRKRRFAAETQRLQFGPAIRAAMEVTGYRWLSRLDQRVCLLRALDDPPTGGADMRLKLRRDAAAWFDALVELDEEGRDSGGPLDPTRYVDPGVVSLLASLHDRARVEAAAAREGRLPLEAAALRWLDQAFEPPSVVVMEGFTRLTPMQRAFIQRCTAAGTKLALVVPGGTEQQRGFAAVETEHRWIAPRIDRHLKTPMPAPVETALEFVQRCLFGDGVGSAPLSFDGSIEIRALPTRVAEAEFALNCLRQLKSEGYDLRWKVAVVASDPALYEALLREEDGLQPEALRLFAPQPRNLLLTPVGRFIITLYAVGREGPLDMTPAQFRDLISSGWLGAPAAACGDLFPSLAAQLLDRCRSEGEWRDGLSALSGIAGGGRGATVPPTQWRLPSNFVTPNDAAALQQAFDTVVELRRRLFSGQHGTVGEHARRLLNELDRLDATRVDADVREVMRQIRVALAEMERSGAMDVAAQEFGEVLRGLGEPDEPDEEEPLVSRDGLRVVGLEQVDGVEYDVIIALGLDDMNLPGGSLDRWPRTGEPAADWISRQRYRFLAVTRAAKRRLVLLRPQADGDATCRESPFLRRVSALCPAARVNGAPCVTASPVVGAPPVRARIERERYSVEELSIASLCEHRWRLEAIEPRTRRFANAWQMSWLARADWTAAAVQHLRIMTGGRPQRGTMLAPRLKQSKQEVAPQVRARFAGLSDFDWHGISREVDSQLEWICGLHNAGDWSFGPPLTDQKQLDLPDGRRVMLQGGAQAKGPTPGYTLFMADRDGAWLNGGGKDPSSADHARYLAVQRFITWNNWVIRGKAPDPRLVQAVQRIESTDAPRRPGPYCGYCPVKPRCLGLEPG